MGSEGTNTHWVSQPMLVRHSCWKCTQIPSEEHSITLSRQLRSSKKKKTLQSSLTASLAVNLHSLHWSSHFLVLGGGSWGWCLFLIHLQGIWFLTMFLEILHRKSLQSCLVPSPFTLAIILLLCYKSEELTACVKRAVVSIWGCWSL